jgi:(p)ppGpp synthase/HD superfamily hydrolase
MATFDRAVQLASAAHAGQVDGEGQPYLLHVLRVALAVTDPEARIAAVLHDTVEDTNITLDQLRAEGFSGAVVDAVRCLTRPSGVSYADYVVGVKENALARQVKLADLTDNARLDRNVLDPARFDWARRRIVKYLVTFKFLSDQLDEPTYRQLMASLEDPHP